MLKKLFFLFLFAMVAFGYQDGWQALNAQESTKTIRILWKKHY
ncbi:MAG: hypothetical protein ACLFSQ_08285 [Candidatus Zixiibacteriota bacterium]